MVRTPIGGSSSGPRIATTPPRVASGGAPGRAASPLIGLQSAVGNAAFGRIVAARRPQGRPPGPTAQRKVPAKPERKTEVWDVAQLTLYVNGDLIVLDLDDGSRRTLQVTYNGRPAVGTYLASQGDHGTVRTTKPLSGKANDAGKVIGWAAPLGVHLRFDEAFVLTVSGSHPNVAIDPEETGHPTPSHDKLYFRPGRGRGTEANRESRLVGDRILDWGRTTGYTYTGAAESIRRQYFHPGSESSFVDDVHLHLIERIRQGPTQDPFTGAREEDDFEGSPLARDAAVVRLTRRWDAVGRPLRSHALSSFQDKFQAAIARTRPDAEMVAEAAQLESTRLHPNKGKFVADPGHNSTRRVGDPWESDKVIADFDGGLVYFRYSDDPLWLYQIGIDAYRGARPDVGDVAAEVAANTRFAGELWPFLIKMAGVGAGFAGGWAAAVVGMALEELGDEGLRSVRNERPRTMLEILESIGPQLFIEGVMHVSFHVAPAAIKRYQKGAKTTVKEFEGQAAHALREQLADAEGPLISHEMQAGRYRQVDGPAGKTREVDITVDGHPHTYREGADGHWCRHTVDPVCYLKPRVPPSRQLPPPSMRTRRADDLANAAEAARMKTIKDGIAKTEKEIAAGTKKLSPGDRAWVNQSPRHAELAWDSARGNYRVQEAEQILEFERTGVVPGPVKRSVGNGDFLDGHGREWGLKAAVNAETVDGAVEKIVKRTKDHNSPGENFLSDLRTLSPMERDQVRARVIKQLRGSNHAEVRFLPAEVDAIPAGR